VSTLLPTHTTVHNTIHSSPRISFRVNQSINHQLTNSSHPKKSPIYSLSNYIVLGRTFYYVPYLSPIHPGRVLTTFIGLDAIIGIITGNGVARASDSSNNESSLNVKIGLALIRTSIILQLLCFILFIILEIIFHRRCIRTKIIKNQKLRTIIYVLYMSSGCILIRNAYRVVEVWQGYDGYLAQHEVFFYMFDGTLLLINSVTLNFLHPMNYLPPSWKIYLAEDGVTELEGDCVMDKRPCWVTVVDPFDLVGLIRGRRVKVGFREG
jgi:hypothetical protein